MTGKGLEEQFRPQRLRVSCGSAWAVQARSAGRP